MSLIGPRPRSVDALAPRRALPPVRPGSCYECGTDLKTSLQATLHRCDRLLTMKHRRLGERDARVRL